MAPALGWKGEKELARQSEGVLGPQSVQLAEARGGRVKEREKGRHVTGPRPKLRVLQMTEKQARGRSRLGEDNIKISKTGGRKVS